MALAECRRPSALAASQLDLSPRSRFRSQGGTHPGLYERLWEGVPLLPTDFVISADEKTSVQARRPKQPTLAGASGRPMRVEHEYFREGAWT